MYIVLGLSWVKEEGNYYSVKYDVNSSVEDADIYLDLALRGVGVIPTLDVDHLNSWFKAFATFSGWNALKFMPTVSVRYTVGHVKRTLTWGRKTDIFP